MTVRHLAPLLAAFLVLGLAVEASAQGRPGASSPRRKAAAKADDAKDREKSETPAEAPADATKGAQDKTSADAKADPAKPSLEKATFGGGCFWCMEAVFERIRGVKSVVSGYAGGTVARPSYELVCTGITGHAEVIQLVYDPKEVTYDDLLQVFWAAHDPTTLNRQGPDVGTQYRSVIFYHNEAQKQAAQKSYRQLTDAGVYNDPIVTELVPYKVFYPADRHHQDYFRRNRNAPYCQMVIAPKLMKLMHLQLPSHSEKPSGTKGEASGSAAKGEASGSATPK